MRWVLTVLVFLLLGACAPAKGVNYMGLFHTYADYTVVLMYPDYMTGDYGADVYVGRVNARTITEAIGAAKQHMARRIERNMGVKLRGVEGLRMVLVLQGNVNVVADATWSEGE